jgi:hypothetical protein
MKKILWVYEYKDDDTLIGATAFHGELHELPEDFKLAHLRDDWHWRVEVLIEKDESDY